MVAQQTTGSGGADNRERPLVSVVLPTYGRDERLFRAAVESVADQTYNPVELVVVDDSPDGVSAWLDARTDWFSSVQCIRGGDHDGAGAARNTGIRRATGDLVAFLDDDDTWLPEKLARQVETFRQSGDEVGVVYTALEYVRDGEVLRRGTAPTRGDVTEAILTGASLGTFSTLVVRASLIPVAGPIDTKLPVLEDREWCLRLSRHCRFETVDECLVRYRQGEYEQLTDDYEALRDVAVPHYRRKHRGLAASYGRGCERRFLASLSQTRVNAALSSGAYGDARRFALQALRHDPTDSRSWMYFAAALGGSWTHTSLRWLRRKVHLLSTRLSGAGSV